MTQTLCLPPQVLQVFHAAPELTDMLEAVEEAAGRFGGFGGGELLTCNPAFLSALQHDCPSTMHMLSVLDPRLRHKRC